MSDRHSRTWPTRVFFELEGELTWEAIEEAAQLVQALRAMNLEPIVCPECTAQDNVRFALNGVEAQYVLGDAPQALRELEAFVQTLTEQLRACEGDRLAWCAAQWRARADVGPSPCQLSYGEGPFGTGAVHCELPVDATAPCRDVAACLCAAHALPPGAQDLPACVDSWTTPRGEVTFADFCAGEGQEPSMNMAQALAGFADFRAVPWTSRGCESLPAQR